MPFLVPSLTHIVNLSLSTGIMLKSGNYADLRPIFKGGDPIDLEEFDVFYDLDAPSFIKIKL